MPFHQTKCSTLKSPRFFFAYTQFALPLFLLIGTIMNGASAGTWLSFNQKSGGSEHEMMPHDRLFSKSKERYPLKEQFSNPTIQDGTNSGNIINLLELCNERNKRKRFAQPTASNDLCNTLLRAVDYDLHDRRRR